MLGRTATLGLIVIIAAGAVVSTLTWALLEGVVIPSSGTVKAIEVGVYWDSGCTNEVTSIEWGVVDVGATKNVGVYVRNEGAAAVTLSLDTENWSPLIAASYITLSWDYGGEVLVVDDVVLVTLTLSVSDLIEGITNFSFDIVIVESD